MNLRHAAALTLVGWYLMMPPILAIGDTNDVEHGEWWTQTDAPVFKWQISSSFDSASDCEDLKSKLIKRGGSEIGHAKANSYNRAFAVASTQALCIATDDPRLKETK